MMTISRGNQINMARAEAVLLLELQELLNPAPAVPGIAESADDFPELAEQVPENPLLARSHPGIAAGLGGFNRVSLSRLAPSIHAVGFQEQKLFFDEHPAEPLGSQFPDQSPESVFGVSFLP